MLKIIKNNFISNFISEKYTTLRLKLNHRNKIIIKATRKVHDIMPILKNRFFLYIDVDIFFNKWQLKILYFHNTFVCLTSYTNRS